VADELDFVTLRNNAAAKAFSSPEEEGRAVARELSDDPAEAEAQAGEWLASQPTPLLPGRVETGRVSVTQAADPEGGQTVEEAKAQHRKKIGDWPERPKFMSNLPGYSKDLLPIVSSLPPELSRLLTGVDLSEGGASPEDLEGLRVDPEELPPREYWPFFEPKVRRALERIGQLRDKYEAMDDEMGEERGALWRLEQDFPTEEGE